MSVTLQYIDCIYSQTQDMLIAFCLNDFLYVLSCESSCEKNHSIPISNEYIDRPNPMGDI